MTRQEGWRVGGGGEESGERVEVHSRAGSPMDRLSGGRLGSVLLCPLEWGCRCLNHIATFIDLVPKEVTMIVPLDGHWGDACVTMYDRRGRVLILCMWPVSMKYKLP